MSVHHLQVNSTYIPGRAPTRAMIQQHSKVAERERLERERIEKERSDKVDKPTIKKKKRKA